MRLVTVNKLEVATCTFENANLYSQDCQHVHAKPLAELSTKT